MYQIFTDRFCNGDPDNDVESMEYVYIGKPVYRVKDWGRNPSTMDVGCFYGGDLKGVGDKLDYIQSLGVEAIYLNLFLYRRLTISMTARIMSTLILILAGLSKTEESWWIKMERTTDRRSGM